MAKASEKLATKNQVNTAIDLRYKNRRKKLKSFKLLI